MTNRLELKELPKEVVDACTELGMTGAEILDLSNREMFEKWCQWEGLIGYSDTIYNIILRLEGVRKS